MSTGIGCMFCFFLSEGENRNPSSVGEYFHDEKIDSNVPRSKQFQVIQDYRNY